MTPIEIFAVVLMVGLVVWGIYRLIIWAAGKAIDGLSEMTVFDDRMRYQPRASTDPEPSNGQALLCVVFVAAAIVALALLWCGFADEMVRCMAAHVVAMHPR